MKCVLRTFHGIFHPFLIWAATQEIRACGKLTAKTFICVESLVLLLLKAMQGKDAETIDKDHGAACLKHFLGYNSNSGKDRNPLSIHPRELKEIHAPAFQAAMDAGAKSIMINSGLLNGIPVHASHDILTTLVARRNGFYRHGCY